MEQATILICFMHTLTILIVRTDFWQVRFECASSLDQIHAFTSMKMGLHKMYDVSHEKLEIATWSR